MCTQSAQFCSAWPKLIFQTPQPEHKVVTWETILYLEHSRCGTSNCWYFTNFTKGKTSLDVPYQVGQADTAVVPFLVRAKCVRWPWALPPERSGQYSSSSLFLLDGNFSPRRCCPRVMKFSCGPQFPKKQAWNNCTPPFHPSLWYIWYICRWTQYILLNQDFGSSYVGR